MVNGKLESSGPAVPGTIAVSASKVRFTASDPKNADLNAILAPGEAEVAHFAGKSFGLLSSRDAAYQFVFVAVCFTCKNGEPAPVPDEQKSVMEYGLVQDSIKNFGPTFKRISDIAMTIRVGVTPVNQPGDKDVRAAMGLYSDLNHKLALMCPTPAQACVQSYEKYQACKAGTSSTDCGEPPACSAFCPLQSESIKVMGASVCTARTQDYASLTPDWTPVLDKEEAAARAAGPGKFVLQKEDAPLSVASRVPGCTVAGSYSAASTAHMIKRPGIAADAKPAAIPPTAIIHVTPQLMAKERIGGDSPIYPAIAKAAHLQGAVVLHATISKEGDVSELSVVSGPEMLRPAAMKAVTTWKFRPFVIDGVPRIVETTITVNFNFSTSPASDGSATN